MWILLGGTFYTGGLVVGGPFKTQIEAEESMGAMERMYDLGTCPEFWCFELTMVEDEDFDYARDGNAIVFDGDITREKWRFYGPFKNTKAARKFASITRGCAIELKPVPVMEPAS